MATPPRAAGQDAGDLILAAQRLLAENRAAAALALYRDAYALGGRDADALTGIGSSLLALGRPELAEPLLKRARSAWGRADRAAAHYAFGRALLQMGRFGEAAEAFARARQAGGGARAMAAEAVARDALGDHDRALRLFAAAVDHNVGADAAVRNNLALSQALHGDVEGALQTYRRLAEEGAADVRVRHNLALTLLLAGREDKAHAILRIDLEPEAARQTLAAFRKLVALEPAKARVRALIAMTGPMSRAPSDAAVPEIADSAAKRALVRRLIAEPEQKPAPPPPAKPKPEPVDLPPLLDPTGWAVQIAAYRTPEQLRRGQRYYWTRYKEVLGGYEPRRSEIDYGPRAKPPKGFFYRLNVGGLQGRAEAEALCRRLKAAGAPCWVRPPEPSEGRLPTAQPDSGSPEP